MQIFRDFAEPSGGLEPSTPPTWNVLGNRSQPTATVVTTGLHKVSIFVVVEGNILADLSRCDQPQRQSYAAAGGPNQVVNASGSPSSARSPTQATYPSGRINTAVRALTAPRTGSSHGPA